MDQVGQRLAGVVALSLACGPQDPEAFDSAVDAGPELDFCQAGEVPTLGLLDRAAEAGVADEESRNRGASVADFDSDGDMDLFTANLGDPGRLYLNDGTGSFVEQPEAPTVAWALASSAIDYDNDGDVDLWLACGGFSTTCTNGLFRNDGVDEQGHIVWTDLSASSGLGTISAATFGGAWADVDNDGDLDLYESTKDLRLNWLSLDQGGPTPDGGDWGVAGQPALPDLEEPPTNRLWLNQGDHTFVDHTEAAGLLVEDNAHQALWVDADEDGDLDLFVPVFMGTNRFYDNQGDGTFVETTTEARVGEPLLSFAALVRDFDQDGHLDLLVGAFTEPHVEQADEHGVFMGRGDGTFRHAQTALGITPPGEDRFTPVMGFQAGDLDLDGHEEVLFGFGHPQEGGALEDELWSPRATEDGDTEWVSLTELVRVPPPGELADRYPARSHGTVIEDFDGDHIPDLFVGSGGIYDDQREPNRLFMGQLDCVPHFLVVDLDGVQSNREGIGARVTVVDSGTGAERTALVQASSGFNSSQSPILRIGLGDSPGPYEVRVEWPSGAVDLVEDVEPGRRLRVVEGEHPG